jgi:DNA-binding transcriptional LysR family regulator
MKSSDNNRIHEMEIFAQVVDSGNFSEAARSLNMNPSSISKLILRLETRLGIRLLHRTTRKVVLTEDGERFYHRVVRILADIKEAEAALRSQPTGKVRITCSIPFALHQLIPILADFTHANPAIEIILLTTDTVVDLLAERCDIAIRIGSLADSALKMRKLAQSKMLVVAAPQYLQRHGIPRKLTDLAHHTCLNFYNHPELNRWPFQDNKTPWQWTAKQSFSADNGESIVKMVQAGGGIARLSAFMVRESISQGTLVPLLEDYNLGEWQPIYLLHHGHLAARVKCVIDFIFKQLGGKHFT